MTALNTAFAKKSNKFHTKSQSQYHQQQQQKLQKYQISEDDDAYLPLGTEEEDEKAKFVSK